MKCHSCGQEGFANPYEIRMHKPSCGVPISEDPKVDMVMSPVEVPQVVLQSGMAHVAATPVNPVGDLQIILGELFNELFSADAKSAVAKLIADPDFAYFTPDSCYARLFQEIKDGDERALLRKYFKK